MLLMETGWFTELTCTLSIPVLIKRPLVNIGYIYHELYRAYVRVHHHAKHLHHW